MAVGHVYTISGCKKMPKEKLACPLSKRFDNFMSDYDHWESWGKVAWLKRESMGVSIAHPRKTKKICKYNFE